jgi:hypothetical protein
MTAESDRQILLGLLALQDGLIGPDQLSATFHAWMDDTVRPMGDHLVAAGFLDAAQRSALEEMVTHRLATPGRTMETPPTIRPRALWDTNPPRPWSLPKPKQRGRTPIKQRPTPIGPAAWARMPREAPPVRLAASRASDSAS